MKRKQLAIAKLFDKFPSTASLSPEDLVSKIRGYLETLNDFTDEDVEGGCQDMAKVNCAFAPSAGQIYAMAEKRALKRIEAQKVQRLRLAKPEHEYPEEHRAEMQKRFADLLAELKSGANFNPQYGLVPKGTKAAKPIVERVVPGSFIDRWERENGRPYPMRDRVLALVNDQYREAAE